MSVKNKPAPERIYHSQQIALLVDSKERRYLKNFYKIMTNAKEVSDDHKEKFEWLKQLILIHIDIDTGRSKLVCGLKFLTFIIKLITIIKHRRTK